MQAFYGFICLSLLAGCAKNDNHLTGKREDVIVTNLNVEISNEAGELILSPSTKNPFIGTIAFSKNISPLWKYKFYDLNLNGNIITTSPVLADEKVFILDAGGIVHCLDTKTGKLLWKTYTTIAGETGQSGGAISYAGNDTVLVSTAFGEVFFINAHTGQGVHRLKLPSPCKGDGILVKDGIAYFNCIANDVCAVDIKNKKIIWTYKDIERESGYVGMAQPIAYKNTLLIVSSAGELICLDKRSGKEMWKILLSNYSVTDASSAIPHIRANPIIENNTVYVNSPSGMLYAVNAESGDIVWSCNIGSLTPVNITGNHLFIVTENNDLACINKNNGKVLSINKINVPQQKEWAITKWFSSPNRKQKNTIFQFLISDSIMHISSAGNVVFSKYNDNVTLAKYEIKHPISVRPVLVEQELYVLSDDGYLIKYGPVCKK